MTQTDNRRRSGLLDAIKSAVSTFLFSTKGTELLGAGSYIAVNGPSHFILKTADGEYYTVKVVKSAWKDEL